MVDPQKQDQIKESYMVVVDSKVVFEQVDHLFVCLGGNIESTIFIKGTSGMLSLLKKILISLTNLMTCVKNSCCTRMLVHWWLQSFEK